MLRTTSLAAVFWGMLAFGAFAAVEARPEDDFTVGRFQNEGKVAKTSLGLSGQAKLQISAFAPVDVSGIATEHLALRFELRITRNDGVTGEGSINYVRNGRIDVFDAAGENAFHADSPAQRAPAAERVAGKWVSVEYPLAKLRPGAVRLGSVTIFDYNDIPHHAEKTGITYEARGMRIVDTSRDADGDRKTPGLAERKAAERERRLAGPVTAATRAKLAKKLAAKIDVKTLAEESASRWTAALAAAKKARTEREALGALAEIDEAREALVLADKPIPPALAAATKAVENPDPLTIANPIDLEYMMRRGKIEPNGKFADAYIESADPALVLYKGEYWLFASHGDGYWVSKDMGKWEFIPVDVTKPLLSEFKRYAPATAVVDGTLYLCHSEGGRILKTTNPRDPSAWEDVGKPDGWMDPGMLYDDPATGGDGYVYLYRGLTHCGPIEVLRLDPKNGMKKVGGPWEVAWPDKLNRGFEVNGDENDRYEANDTQEGAWAVKRGGKYYLTCAVPGTQFASYSDNCYISDSPLGPFVFAPNSPIAWKATGFTQGAGHGCLFEDLNGRWWKVDTCRVRGFNRRLVLLPSFFGKDGSLYTDTVGSDLPFYVPGKSADPIGKRGPGWRLLSFRKKATASSNGGAAPLAFNEEMFNHWMADTEEPGEWLQVDLGKVCAVHSVQVNFADVEPKRGGRIPGEAYRYLLEFSPDGEKWYPMVDRTKATVNRQHEYVEFVSAVGARFVRIVNKGPVPNGCRWAISGLRIFGEGGSYAPAPVDMDSVCVNRRPENNRTASFEWDPAPGAQGYVIRYGLSPDALFTHFQVDGSESRTINSFNRGVDYYFTIDSYNESGVTAGRKTLKMAATEPMVDGYDVRTNNPAFLMRDPGVKLFEAEASSFGGKGVKSEYEVRASRVHALHGLGPAGTFAQFDGVPAPDGGSATLRVSYSAIDNAKAVLKVNGAAAGELELPKTKGWPTYNVVERKLEGLKDVNTIRIEGAGDRFHLDWIQLVK